VVERRALVSGASVAGLATAFWLHRVGWQVRVIERAERFRDGGQNVDVRGVARDVLDRMGLTDEVAARTTTEKGTRFVDADGGSLAEFPRIEGTDGPTAELEILRGDLARVLLASLPDDVEIAYGTAVTAVEDHPTHVTARLTDGTAAEADLLVVAEGVRSTTRGLVMPDLVTATPLDLAMVYGTIEKGADDDGWWNWYAAPRSRQVTTRPDPVGTTRATLAWVSPSDELTDASPARRIELLSEVFDDAGWQSSRVVEGFARSDDVYADHLTQISMSRWSRGRTVATGDAAWCVTPLGGGGCSLALTGAYVLAAALARGADDLPRALRAYEAWMRPLTDRAQQLPPGMPRLAYPRSRWGLAVRSLLIRLAGSPPLARRVAARMGDVATDERALPSLAGAGPDTSPP
jgi:2-polyprenyl-6-methoxyphenol hydroxylase-like FAD-dependent oxidoreductase